MSWVKVDNGFEPSTRFGGQIVSVKFDAAVLVEVSLEKRDGGIQISVHPIGVGESDESRWVDDLADSFPSSLGGPGSSDEHGSSAGEPLANDSLDSGDDHVVSQENVVPPKVVDDNTSTHNSSPSVGVDGAGCGDLHPTEGELDAEPVAGPSPAAATGSAKASGADSPSTASDVASYTIEARGSEFLVEPDPHDPGLRKLTCRWCGVSVHFVKPHSVMDSARNHVVSIARDESRIVPLRKTDNGDLEIDQ